MAAGFVSRVFGPVVELAGRRPLWTLLLAFLLFGATASYAKNLEPRTDLLELLPRDSPGFKAFEHQLGRVGGGATLLVIVESPERAANERFIDDISARLEKIRVETRACHERCGPDGACHARCPPDLMAYLETGTKDVRQFFEEHKWLYADIKDLEDADATLDRQIALASGLVSDLDAEDKPAPKPGPAPAPPAPGPAPKPAPGASAAAPPPPPPPNPEKKSALGMDEFRARWKDRAKRNDDFPTGYFATDDGKAMGIRIVSTGSGMGDRSGDALMSLVRSEVEAMKPAGYHPQLAYGFAGDIPNVIDEKESLMSDAAWATGIAVVLILGGVVFFFRSAWSLVIIAIPAFLGVTCAYAFAMAVFGYVNTAGAFLGAIIIGNGTNYPIVLLSRYREFRARGMAPAEARRDAVVNAFRAELVGALVASIAYGSLTITRFRGFSQFGTIGFVGMFFVWLTMIPIVPALIVVVEAIQARLPPWLRDPAPAIEKDGSRGPLMRVIAGVTEKHPRIILGVAALVTCVAVWKLPAFLKDPWEYNFNRLGSRSTKVSGAGIWSNKAEKVFGGKMNIAGALMLADTPEQVPVLKARIIENDERDPEGRLIADVATVHDLLPGPRPEQEKKLDVLERIRDRLTPAVLASLTAEERQRVEEVRPPETLKPVEAKDLPPLLRRRFEESNGTVGTVLYVKIRNDVSLSDGHKLLRIATTTDNVQLPDGVVVQTASRSTIFAEMIHSMERDGPLATFASFGAVIVVVLIATASWRGALAVLAALLMGVVWTVGLGAFTDMKLNFLNFIALPITFGIGCEYPFNVFDRARLLGGDVSAALKRTGGAVSLCSYTTCVGYGSLLFNDNQALQSFGGLAMSGEIACLVGALFVVPAILHVLKKPG